MLQIGCTSLDPMLKSRKGKTMASKKKIEKINLDEIKEEDKLKYEIATELGLLDKVLDTGWRSLSAKESGRIGGIITKRKKEAKKKEEEKKEC